MLAKCCYIPHTSRQLVRKKAQRTKARQLSYSNASRCGFINKQTRVTMEHASAVTAATKASSGSFAMLEAYYPDHATKCRCCVRINSPCSSASFRSMKRLTAELTGAKVQSMLSLAQINFEKACMKNEWLYVKQHWHYEHDYKCNRYSLVTTTVALKQLHVTYYKDSPFLNLMY